MFILPLLTDGVRSRALAVALVMLTFVATTIMIFAGSELVPFILGMFVLVFVPEAA